MGDHFFLFFLGTIVFTRFLLIEEMAHSPAVLKFQLHHYAYGIILVVIAFIYSNLTLYAIGSGLFIDELPQLITNSFKTWQDYYSRRSLMGVLLLSLLVYIFRTGIAAIMKV